MDLHLDQQYPATADRLFAMLTDPEFVRQMFTALGQSDIEVSVVREGPDVVVHSVRTVEVAVPGFAKRVLSPRNRVEQTDRWHSPVAGEWSVTTHGVPVSMTGSYAITGDGDHATLSVTGRLKVSIPLIGGRLEGFAADQARAQLAGQHDAGLRWLATHG